MRTPARLAESLKRWDETLPSLIEETLAEAVATLETAHREGKQLKRPEQGPSDVFPGRVIIKPSPDDDQALLGFETVAGRSLWLFNIKHLLSQTANALLEHRWTILRSPPGMEWLTTDNPVVRLNYHSEGRYDFGGGWGSPGTEIFMPLSPQHLMYTQVGRKPPRKGTVLSVGLALSFQRFIVEHAHRFVFSRAPHAEVADWKPRVVDSVAFAHEAEQWKRWHELQTEAEQRLAHPQSPVDCGLGAATDAAELQRWVSKL